MAARLATGLPASFDPTEIQRFALYSWASWKDFVPRCQHRSKGDVTLLEAWRTRDKNASLQESRTLRKRHAEYRPRKGKNSGFFQICSLCTTKPNVALVSWSRLLSYRLMRSSLCLHASQPVQKVLLNCRKEIGFSTVTCHMQREDTQWTTFKGSESISLMLFHQMSGF